MNEREPSKPTSVYILANGMGIEDILGIFSSLDLLLTSAKERKYPRFRVFEVALDIGDRPRLS